MVTGYWSDTRVTNFVGDLSSNSLSRSDRNDVRLQEHTFILNKATLYLTHYSKGAPRFAIKRIKFGIAGVVVKNW